MPTTFEMLALKTTPWWREDGFEQYNMNRVIQSGPTSSAASLDDVGA